MKKIILFSIILILSANSVFASDAKNSVMLGANQVKIQVKGIVCSFCAYGAQKNLSKLKFLNPKEFKKGVLVDVKNQQITLALAEDKKVDLKEIYDSIRKGGYEPVTFYMLVEGKITESESGLFIEDEKSDLRFVLNDSDVKSSAEVKGIVHFDAELIKSLDNERTIQASIERLEYK